MLKILSWIVAALLGLGGSYYGATILTTNSSDTLDTLRTNVNTSLTNLNTAAGSVTSIAFGDGVTGGTITTSGNVNLKSYIATSTADTLGYLAYSGSTNGWPAKLAYVATSTLNFSVAYSTSTTLGYLVGGTSGVVSSVIQPSFTYSTSTAWTGTTTISLQQVNLAETINGIRCLVKPTAATLNIQTFYGAATTTMLNASSTTNFNAFSTNNTPVAPNGVGINIGTPSGSPTSINCTYKMTL